MERKVHEKVKAFIEKHELINAGNELVLGVSGGADSMMMLFYFYFHQKEYNITLKVAHVHHGLRETARLDANLVEAFCAEKEIPFFRHDCNIKALSKERKISEEEAGREERYNFFISLLNESGKIVTAHNMNDQAETMLMRFVRGTDIKGLAGILPKRDHIIRPLLCLTRQEIEAYCKEMRIPYRDDETNFQTLYTRNKIRLECIPYIKEHLNPAIISSLGRQSELYRQEDEFLSLHAKELYDKCAVYVRNEIHIDLDFLKQQHVYMQKKVIRLAIGDMIGLKDISNKHIDSCTELITLPVGKEVHLPLGLVMKKDYHIMILRIQTQRDKEASKDQSDPKIQSKKEWLQNSTEADGAFCIDLTEGKQYIKEAGLMIELCKISAKRINQNNENIYTKYIDYGKIKSGLQIRTQRSLDYIRLKSGSKKLKKLFTDDKISKTIRDTIPLIADGDEIVWVIGNRLNYDYYVTQYTDEVLEIKILKEY